MIEIAHAGVISDAPSFATVLLNALRWLLSIFAFLGIIALVISGTMYLTAFGDSARLTTAKNMFTWSLIGVVVSVGSLVLVRTMASFFAG